MQLNMFLHKVAAVEARELVKTELSIRNDTMTMKLLWTLLSTYLGNYGFDLTKNNIRCQKK